MKEISLHILDIAQNAVAAEARLVQILLREEGGQLTVCVSDDGRGMSPELLAAAANPFTTTRTTRKVGLGLPLFRLAAEQTGGSMTIESTLGVGTSVQAVFFTGHIDCPPMGDMAATVATLAQGAADEMELIYTKQTPQGIFCFDTAQVRQVLGPDVPLSVPEVAQWVRDYVAQGEQSVQE